MASGAKTEGQESFRSLACASIVLVLQGGLAVWVSSPFTPKRSLEVLQLRCPSRKLLVITRFTSKICPVANVPTDRCRANTTGTAALALRDVPPCRRGLGAALQLGLSFWHLPPALGGQRTPSPSGDGAGGSCSCEDLTFMS